MSESSIRKMESHQTVRQGLAVLMASVVVKHETTAISQSHNCQSIDFKFSMGDEVREVTSPEKCCSDQMSGRDATWGQHIRVL